MGRCRKRGRRPVGHELGVLKGAVVYVRPVDLEAVAHLDRHRYPHIIFRECIIRYDRGGMFHVAFLRLQAGGRIFEFRNAGDPYRLDVPELCPLSDMAFEAVVGNVVHEAEGLHGEVVGYALALVPLIERFKLFPFRYRHTFGIVQASLTLLSLNAMFLLS